MSVNVGPDDRERVERLPASTYRLQFGPSLTFDRAAGLVDYLEDLGITAVYCSPIFQPMAGSAHGYDVVDHARVNEELGGEDAFRRFAAAVRKRGMGLIVDLVPNHMAAAASNAWWRDVLENGPSSPYARFFDIDWNPPVPDLEEKILLPILGDQFGRVLEAGLIQVEFEDGRFEVRCGATTLPLAPRTWEPIMRAALRFARAELPDEHEALAEFESIITALRYLPKRFETDPERVRERQREKSVVQRRLGRLSTDHPSVRDAIGRALRQFNGSKGDSRSFNRLEKLLHDQPYRLSYWRVASDEINYRRFFDINDLAAIRVEEPEVFARIHERALALVSEHLITGFRIDHPDGLYDPARYFSDLERAACEAAGTDSFFIVIEKILGPRETLRPEWAVRGTTGYDFLNQLDGIFVDGENADAIREIYRRFVGDSTSFRSVMYASRKLIMDTSMSSEIHVLARRLARIAKQHRHTRDFTFSGLLDALIEMIAGFPVYRTYIDGFTEKVSDEDRRYVLTAVHSAKRRNPAISESLFEFIADVLLLEDPPDLDDAHIRARREFVMRFQQITGPVMAKGVEDTAFYRWFPLSSLNEVGGYPEIFGIPVKQFHYRNAQRLDRWKGCLLAASTHDTKRAEDVRARINVLSEIPGEWEEALRRWHSINRDARRRIDDSDVPDCNEEYLIYQTLLGTWPFGELTGESRAAFVQRIQGYIQKALNEAKVHTSWVSANREYEAAVREFIDEILLPRPENAFLPDFYEFLKPVARAGIWNSLSTLLLRIAAPGIPDFYQGSELWNFSLVDPDNRRPVDWDRLARVADTAQEYLLQGARNGLEEGATKLLVLRQALRYRRADRALFENGAYIPIDSRGSQREHIVAFARVLERRGVIAVAGRFFAKLQAGERDPVGPAVWGDTCLDVSKQLPAGDYRDLLSGRIFTPGENGQLAIAGIFRDLPIALLESVG